MKHKFGTEQSAQVFRQLQRMASSGIPYTQLPVLNAQSPHVALFRRFERELGRGSRVAQAGMRAGLWGEHDAELIELASVGGIEDAILDALAGRDELAYMRKRRMKSAMVMPFFVLLLALFVQPLPALVAARISVASYLWGILSPLGVLALLAIGIRTAPKFLRNHPASARLYDWAEYRLPFLGVWKQRRDMNAFLFSMGMMYRAGVPLLDIVGKIARPIQNQHFRSDVERFEQQLRAGESIDDALVTLRGLPADALLALRVGASSGRFDASILHHVEIEQENLNRHDDHLAEWMPRLFYACVIIFVLLRW